MGPKKQMKLKEKLDLEDVFCIACRCIYIRPVTMPCDHTLCLECFKNMVNITAYQCPMCRKRISNWLRKYKHDWDSLVNEKFWEVLQQQYPVEVQKRLNDEDDGLEERIVTQSVTHVPIKEGEIKKEFDDMLMTYQREQDQLELNNLKLIKQLQEEEKANLRARKVSNEELMQNDVDLASSIQEEINNELHQEHILLNESDKHFAMQLQNQISSELEDKKKSIKNSGQKKSPSKRGPLDIMLSRLFSKTINENKENTFATSCSSTPSSSFTGSLCTSSSTSLAQSTCTSSSTSFFQTPSLSSGYNSGPCTSFSTTSDNITDNLDDNSNICTCGRLHDDFDSELPPCQFCYTQITLFDRITQQKNDLIMAKDLEKKYKMENFEDYNLRKRKSSPFKSVARKKNRKLSKGQQTLKQILKENDCKTLFEKKNIN